MKLENYTKIYEISNLLADIDFVSFVILFNVWRRNFFYFSTLCI